MSEREHALPLAPSDPRWLALACANVDAIHRDHLHCERKAAQSALSLMRSYPEHGELVAAMARLAHEETKHVVQVAGLLARTHITPGYDHGDDYAAALRTLARKREPDRLLDRLLIFAVIEGRSAERLALLAGALPRSHDARAVRAARRRRGPPSATSSSRSPPPPPPRPGSRAPPSSPPPGAILAGREISARIH